MRDSHCVQTILDWLEHCLLGSSNYISNRCCLDRHKPQSCLTEHRHKSWPSLNVMEWHGSEEHIVVIHYSYCKNYLTWAINPATNSKKGISQTNNECKNSLFLQPVCYNSLRWIHTTCLTHCNSWWWKHDAGSYVTSHLTHFQFLTLLYLLFL